MATGDLYRVDVRGRYLGQLTVNTFYWREFAQLPPLPGELAPGELGGINGNQLLAAFIAAYATNYSAYGVSGMVFDTVRASRLSPRRADRRSFTASVNWHSADTRQGLPSMICAVIKRVCSPGTRAGNGRLYFSGVAALDTNDGEVIVVSQAGAQLAQLAILMREQLTSGVITWTPGVVNPRVAPPPGHDFTFYPLRSTTSRLTIGQNRHRAPGHGRSG